MRQAELHRMRRIIRELVDMLPEERKNSPRVKELAGWSCTTTMHLVECSANRG
jgi:NTE family protein